MGIFDPETAVAPDLTSATLPVEANTAAVPPRGEIERMARRRFQNPTPKRRGNWWYIQFWKDDFTDGAFRRKKAWHKLGPGTMAARKAQKEAEAFLWPINQGLEHVGGATPFQTYIEGTYNHVVMPLLAKSTQYRYRGVISNYLMPQFGKLCLRDLTKLTIQTYLTSLSTSQLAAESEDKIRDVLSAILVSAVNFGLLVQNPAAHVRLPAERRGRRFTKPVVTPAQFDQLLGDIPEPYATMFYVAVYTGLRVSELIGLRWEDVHEDSVTIDERFCRGDWGAPKSEASNATIGVNRCVIERIHRLKLLTVEVKAGRAVRKYRVVKSDGPTDLVFQSVKDGKPMRDNNILTRFLKPAARRIGLPFVNWWCLRTSHATWLKMAGADVKDAQAQMRHSRASTTLDIYQQFVPESQQRVVARLSTLSQRIN